LSSGCEALVEQRAAETLRQLAVQASVVPGVEAWHLPLGDQELAAPQRQVLKTSPKEPPAEVAVDLKTDC